MNQNAERPHPPAPLDAPTETGPRFERQAQAVMLLGALVILLSLFFGWQSLRRYEHAANTWENSTRQATAISNAMADFNREAGYGGLIHNFKNMVLRRDVLRYQTAIEANFVGVYRALDTLDTLLQSDEARGQLAFLRGTFTAYEASFARAKSLIGAGASEREIDEAAKVNDVPALAAIAALDARVSARERAALVLAQTSMASAQRFALMGGTLMMLGLGGALGTIFWFLRSLVIAHTTTRRVQLYLDTLLDTAPDAILSVARDGRIVRSNRVAEQFFGYRRDELLGMPVETLLPERLRAAHLGLRAGYTANPTQRPMGLGKTLIARRHDGTECPVEISLSHLGSGADQQTTVSLRDVTERLASQQALERVNGELARSNADLEQFAFAASHDLQEPLRSVASCVQLLQKRYEGQLDARADQFITHAVDGARRMQTLINDLLAYSRISATPRQDGAVPSQHAVDTACANLLEARRAAEATVTTGTLPSVQGDAAQLALLFQNLIGNALKFRGDKPAVVHIEARPEGAQWLFSVADQGIGMEPQYFKKVFELFQRLHTRQEYAGTGIGLALCKRIVERHGGRIWVDAQPGKGTTFFFTLIGLQAP